METTISGAGCRVQGVGFRVIHAGYCCIVLAIGNSQVLVLVIVTEATVVKMTRVAIVVRVVVDG